MMSKSQSMGDMVNEIPQQQAHRKFERERCELLSAYLDGEVTATERQQVEHWLASDASFRDKYERLSRLRDGFRSLSAASRLPSAEATTQMVVTSAHQRSRRQRLRFSAVAAVVIGVVASAWLSQSRFSTKLADQPETNLQPQVVAGEPLMVALDQPIITLSKVNLDSSYIGNH